MDVPFSRLAHGQEEDSRKREEEKGNEISCFKEGKKDV